VVLAPVPVAGELTQPRMVQQSARGCATGPDQSPAE
jgi:hypothetical protein